MALKDTLKSIGDRIVVNPSFQGGSRGFAGDAYPWSSSTNDSFFPGKEIDASRVDRIYPYRLVVVDVTDGNKIVGNSGGFRENVEFTLHRHDQGGIKYSLAGPSSAWVFKLPITPQQLSITDQFAINTTATMRGVVEEHNGVKFKTITASGTTGIWPTRDRLDDPNAGLGNTLLGGSLEALGDIGRAGSALLNGGPSAPVISRPEDDNFGQTTGYYQAQLLQQFLEQYAMAKKDPDKKGWRLVFDCPKNSESFVVTPVQYTVTKSQRSPGEHLFNMQFKAWKRIEISGKDAEQIISDLNILTPSFFQQLNDTLDNARSLTSASLNLIKAIRADFRKPFDTLRKLSLLIKDVTGLAIAASELPNQIVGDIKSSIQKVTRDLAVATGGSSLPGFAQSQVRTKSSQAKIRSAVEAISKNIEQNEGLSPEAVKEGQNGTEASNASKTSPVNRIFNEPEANFDFLSSIEVDSLELTPQQSIAIEEEIERNALISAEEIKDAITEIQNLTLDLTNNFGAGDKFFSEITNRPQPRKRATPMSVEEFEIIAALEEVVLNLNKLVATRQFEDTRTQSPLEYVGGLAEDSEVPFNSAAVSKQLVPVPFDLDIQEISARYLGDPDRYNEIISLNNLRSPYIDEDGFSYELLSNGDGRQFNIGNGENLFIGQKIQLFSTTVPLFTRKITDIEKITDQNFLITVDGISDLEKLQAQDKAKLKGFLPGTVNSQNQIFIPSDESIEDEPRTRDIPFLEEDTLTGVSKIDWLISENGDLVLNSFGEASLANGLNNIVQALRMKIATSKGDILSAPSFGLGLKPGVNVAELEIPNVLVDLRNTILSDSRFESIEKLELDILPPKASVNISVRLANGRGLFPINFTV